MPSSRQVGRICILDAARDQRIFDLQVDDRMDGCGPADGVGADFGQADMADIAGLDHVGDGADRVFDRHVRIEPGRAVDVDIVDAEPLQRIGDEVLQRGRAVVHAVEAAGRIAQGAGLDADDDLVAVEPFSASPISISLWPMP